MTLGTLLCVHLTTTTQAASSAPSGTLSLAWDASTSANVTNYTVYYGTASTNYTQTAPAGPATQITLSGLTPGATYFLAVTASASTGLESAYSNELAFTVPTIPPSGPQLSLVRTGTKSIVSWSTNYAGFTLQWSSNPKGTWSDLTSNPQTAGSYFVSTNQTSSTQRYYRLKK